MEVNGITLVSGDDWQGLYVDGTLRIENHRLSARDVIEIVDGVEIEAEEGWLERVGRLPKHLSEVVK